MMNSIYAMSAESILRFIVVLLIFLFVLAITYFTTRWIANFQKNKIGKGNIEVLEATRITNSKSITIVRIGKNYYAVAIGKDNISLIDKLEENSIEIGHNDNTESFQNLISKLVKSKKNKEESVDESNEKENM